MRNKNARNILEKISYLIRNNIKLNIQIVLIPHINDGKILEKTLGDLYDFHEGIESIAIVPVGLTKYRKKLFNISLFTKSEVSKLIDFISEKRKFYRKSIGRGFVYLADEFYLKFGFEFPEKKYYDGFFQIEDGIGMARLFMEEAENTFKAIHSCNINKRIGIVTGVLGKKVLNRVKDYAGINCDTTNIRIFEIKNEFFGEHITVTGLLTGMDIYHQIYDKENDIDHLFLPRIVLNNDLKFLDDMNFWEFKKKFRIPVELVDISGGEFIKKLTINRS